MKTFKTVLITSLVWILVLGGLWTATNVQSEDSKLVDYWINFLPNPVQDHLLSMCQCMDECDCEDCTESTDNTDSQRVNDVDLSAIPETCMSFYDGCNNCNRLEDGELACTMKICETYGEPKCLD